MGMNWLYCMKYLSGVWGFYTHAAGFIAFRICPPQNHLFTIACSWISHLKPPQILPSSLSSRSSLGISSNMWFPTVSNPGKKKIWNVSPFTDHEKGKILDLELCQLVAKCWPVRSWNNPCFTNESNPSCPNFGQILMFGAIFVAEKSVCRDEKSMISYMFSHLDHPFSWWIPSFHHVFTPGPCALHRATCWFHCRHRS